MSVKAIVGANWGDEGKGKMTDYLAENSSIVVRFQGGNNAGHTIINEYGKFALHLLPSGVFYPHVTNIIGPGVAFNISAFFKELDELVAKGVPEPKILVSDRAQILLPYHILFDEYEEERLGSRQFGSTKSGIAPFYADKYYKIGIQLYDIFDTATLKSRLEAALEIKNITIEKLYKKKALIADEITNGLLKYAERLKPYVCDTSTFLNNAVKAGQRILMEGQLGALRDPDHGIYPFSTSSSTLAGFASVGGGVPPYSIKSILAVVKAYSSCVGAGPFVTEIFGDEGDVLRRRGGSDGEFGATTGRPRRMGWFDAVATRYGCLMQGATEVALTLLDVLGYLEEIPVCIGYEIDGQITKDFPVTSKLYKAKPIYKMLPGWKCDISSIREFDKLPMKAQEYIHFIESQIEVPIHWISVGPKREDTIKI